jgi:type VI secretion system protein ImpG
MDDELLRYYEQELTFVRKMGEEFSKKYPKVASRLLLEPGKCDDPGTERLIEAFAFIAGRIHKKIDDNFPEITESLLSIIYPHYTRPVPSMTVVDFQTQKKSVPPQGYRIDKGTPLYSRPVGGIPCQFTTCYPVMLWPMEVISVGLRDPRHSVRNAQQALVLQLKTQDGLKFSQLAIEELRFFLNGPSQQMFPLYEALGNNVCQVIYEFRNPKGSLETLALGPEGLEPVGLSPEETLMSYPERSFPGYGLLLEYFCFPEKYLFFTLKGLERVRAKNPGDTLEIWLYLDKPIKSNISVRQENFLIHTTPAINLFRRIAEPVWVEHTKTEYLIVPDARRSQGTEVYSVDAVSVSSEGREGTLEFHPFYSVRHHLEGDEKGQMAFWRSERRASHRKGDDGTDVYISFTDWALKSVDPGVETLMLNVTCTNRDLPGRLPFGDSQGDFEMELSAPVEKILCLVKPTPTRRPALGAALQWRLISHLALNYLSITEGGEDALKELLKLYDFDDSPATRQQINGLVGLKSTYVTRRIGQSFCRGMQVTLEFDEDKYVGSGLYLFASVLERFLSQYVSINSFTQLTAKTLQRKEPLHIWLPRNGNRILL